MAIRASVLIAASLDGYIARSDGGIDWLGSGDGAEDYGYSGAAKGPHEKLSESVVQARKRTLTLPDRRRADPAPAR